EGREEGEDKLGRLVALLIANGRTGDVQRAAADKVSRNSLYEEFNIV
ncbi:transposase, partial [bacterium D16-54]